MEQMVWKIVLHSCILNKSIQKHASLNREHAHFNEGVVTESPKIMIDLPNSQLLCSFNLAFVTEKYIVSMYKQIIMF